MLTYNVIAKDAATGDKVHTQVQADSEQTATKLLKDRGLSPLEITLSHEGSSLLSRFRNRVKTKDKILFSRQLSTLINAGLPLIQSLRTVAGQTQSKPLKIVINQIINDVEGGMALSAALARHPNVFNQIYVSMVAAGETSGTLDRSLERLAMQQEKDAEIIAKVRGAMVYPIIVLLVMVGVVGFMIVKVLPQVKVMYDGLKGQELPLVTRILLAISEFVTHYWYIVLLVLGLMAFLGSRWLRTVAGREFADKFKMHAPPFGPLFMKLYMARFARTAGALVASGVPLIQVLEITADAINNVHIARSIRNAIDKVKGGTALSEALKDDPNFLSLVPDMLRIGEQSGSIEQMLERVADYYEKEVDTQIKTISTIIEPLLMVVLGICAFIIVAAVLLPIYSLAGKSIIN
ncbi:pilus assembly protein PilC [Candidatus Saccharibacteria bacterium]|nr:MAG: pilus assembly protein PilC [Candidatus Saccharibacteria bacterium]